MTWPLQHLNNTHEVFYRANEEICSKCHSPSRSLWVPYSLWTFRQFLFWASKGSFLEMGLEALGTSLHLSWSLILLFLAINGYIYGNLPGLEMCADTSMSWHLIGMGSEIDIHAAYFYGHTFTNRDQRADVIGLFPATFVTAEMTPGSPGRWLITCQVNEHLRGTLLQIFLILSEVPASIMLGKGNWEVCPGKAGFDTFFWWLTEHLGTILPDKHCQGEISYQQKLYMLDQIFS